MQGELLHLFCHRISDSFTHVLAQDNHEGATTSHLTEWTLRVGSQWEPPLNQSSFFSFYYKHQHISSFLFLITNIGPSPSRKYTARDTAPGLSGSLTEISLQPHTTSLVMSFDLWMAQDDWSRGRLQRMR